MPTEIRTLDEAEVRTVVDWAAAEGWNPGLHDARAFRVADPDGFLWEVCHNPFFPLDEDGYVQLPA